MTLVDRYGPLMLRIALTHVRTRAVAEEVVQESWLGVLQGLDRFEGRSSLKTWILRIVANRARTRGEREARSVPLSSLGPTDRGRAGRRPRPLLRRRPPALPGRLVGPAAQLGPAAGGAAARRRDAGAGARARSRSCPRASRRSSSCATSKAGTPRRSAQALELTDGQPARAAAPRPQQGPQRARALLRRGGGVNGPILPGGISCREVVELVTAYLDGALDARGRGADGGAPASCASPASTTSSRSGRPRG